VSFPSQYRFFSNEQKDAARSAAVSFKENIVSQINTALDVSIQSTIIDVLLGGSFGSYPGYGTVASDFDVFVVVSDREPFLIKEIVSYASNKFNVLMISAGFENVSNIKFILWNGIVDRTSFEGQLEDVTATSLIDAEEFFSSNDFFQKRLA
jgi:hypothetical protein